MKSVLCVLAFTLLLLGCTPGQEGSGLPTIRYVGSSGSGNVEVDLCVNETTDVRVSFQESVIHLPDGTVATCHTLEMRYGLAMLSGLVPGSHEACPGVPLSLTYSLSTFREGGAGPSPCVAGQGGLDESGNGGPGPGESGPIPPVGE